MSAAVATSTRRARPRWRVLDVDGAAVEVMEHGEGDPLLFLHGWGLTPRTYADAVVRLCDSGVRVIAPTLPGSGRSSSLGLRAGMAAYAARVGRLIDVLGVDKPCFVAGHSFGGGVALKLAVDRPELVRSLTLINAVGGAPGPGRSTSTSAGMSRRSWLRWAVGTTAELDPRDLPNPIACARLLSDLVPTLLRHPMAAASSAVVALTASLADDARALVDSGLPVLFVWGDRDRLVTPGALAEVQGSLPSEVVKGRHSWMLGKPEEFAAVLRDALVVHAMLERQRRGHAIYLPKGEPLANLFPAERRRRNRAGSADGRGGAS